MATLARTARLMTLSTALFCLALAACGGGDEADLLADAGGAAGNPPRTAAIPPATNSSLPLSAEELTEISRPFGTRHEALPAGVPLDYDWSQFSKKDRGNTVPEGYRAFTGWGQVFWVSGSAMSGQAVDLRSYQTFLCTIGGTGRRWSRVQQGDIEGAAFRADFAGNENVPASVVAVEPGRARVSFPAGRAYHYWARQGRVTVGTEALCGVLVIFQARAVAPDGSALPAGVQPALLIGGGGDYWVNTTAPWRDYQTNIGVGVGQLRRLSTQWRWYGMGTADATDLQGLQRDGYTDLTRQ